MAQAIVDPQELRRFANHLRQFNETLREQLSSLHAHLYSLADTWRDQEHQKFVDKFEETTRAVQMFLAASEEHVPFLLRKAERAEQYLQER